MAFLCPARVRRAVRKRKVRREDDIPMPGRITGSASIDTLVRVGLEKESLYYEGRPTVPVLHDFTPCVEDELTVRRGQQVTLLYRENDWVYVIASDGQEGFIPFVYCGGVGTSDDLKVHNTRPSSTAGSDSNHEGPSHSGSGTLNKTNSASLPSITDLYAAVRHEPTSVTHTPYGSRMERSRLPDHVPHIGERAETVDSLSNSNASDTPLIDPADVESFSKRPCGRSIVLFRFYSLEENDVSVERGEFVTVLNKDDPEWYWIARSDGQEGFVPSRFLCPADGQKEGNAERSPRGRHDVRARTTSVATSPPPALAPSGRSRLVVLYDYCARAPDDLTVCRGDWVYADLTPDVQTDADWLWAFLPGPDKWGFMPRTYARVPTTENSTVEGRRRMDQFMSP